MAENILKMMNLIEYCEDHKPVISLDFEKAFDKLEWEVIHLALETFRVGPKFRQLLKILYTDPLSCTMNNGFWSNWFSPTRACRQGDPISSLIFCNYSRGARY